MEGLEAFANRLGLPTAVELSAAGLPVPEYEDEEIRAVFPSTSCYLGETSDQGVGTLTITTRRVLWLNGEHSTKVLVLEYPQIVMHAVSRDVESFPHPCIYLQLDEGSVIMEHDVADQADDETEEEDFNAEVRLIPADPSKLDEIFRTMSECAALNPDPDMQEEGEANLFFDEDEVHGNLTEEQRARLEQYDTMLLDMPRADELDELIAEDPERFEDAEDGDEEEEHLPLRAVTAHPTPAPLQQHNGPVASENGTDNGGHIHTKP